MYAAYAAAEPSPQPQLHLPFRALLGRAATAAATAGGEGAVGVEDVSRSPKRICALVEGHVNDFHRQGCYAMTEVVVVYAAWLEKAGYVEMGEGERTPGLGPEERGAGPDEGKTGDPISPARTIRELPHAEMGDGG